MSTISLLETIKIKDGKVFNLAYHQERCDKSREVLFDSKDALDLDASINAPKKGLHRCRIVYDKSIRSVEYVPYEANNTQTLKIVTSNINYEHKYANRDTLNDLLTSRTDEDDILIEKDGYLTDTSIANIAFYDGSFWYTPKNPLLKGTMRQKLLDEGFLKTRNIKKEELSKYTQVALINAMLGFHIIPLPIHKVFQ